MIPPTFATRIDPVEPFLVKLNCGLYCCLYEPYVKNMGFGSQHIAPVGTKFFWALVLGVVTTERWNSSYVNTLCLVDGQICIIPYVNLQNESWARESRKSSID